MGRIYKYNIKVNLSKKYYGLMICRFTLIYVHNILQ